MWKHVCNFLIGLLISSFGTSIWFSKTSMYSVALITCPNSTVAETIADTLVSRKLAACVNIIPSIKSVYVWEGKVERSDELLLMAKTQSKLVPSLTEVVKEIHPYECPEIISLNIEGGYPPYLKWIMDSTS
ncbi:divalent cation tolerance cuta-related [Schistosoma mansoni]|uniref:Divalent cation tolerance cuta-related n=1 Tax=Schistosoma mansoni TaxID=6183 RepID=G4VBZ2_SCHMA|nr:divalent cation tolerance cuta-related [Schistosoma mansoni]|eukprot:XP_018650040.1 divalent cation tolerance cuta-related [Schistosoma mansoni]